MYSQDKALRTDPVPPLLSSGNEALEFFVRRDLLGEEAGPVERLWELPAVGRILRRQREDGSWKYSGGKQDIRSQKNYDQLETYRMLGILVEKYGFVRTHPALQKAADFLFGFQTDEGDFRGIYGTQYTPNYTGGIMELLIKSGFGHDPRIHRGFHWLLSIRQQDVGWAIPLQTAGAKFDREVMQTETLQPDLSKPPSHMTTGCVLRAFAAHDEYRFAQAARVAGDYLASRLFKRHEYPGGQAADFWTKFSYPFWFTDLLSALDSLSRLGFGADEGRIPQALEWLVDRQQQSGT